MTPNTGPSLPSRPEYQRLPEPLTLAEVLRPSVGGISVAALEALIDRVGVPR